MVGAGSDLLTVRRVVLTAKLLRHPMMAHVAPPWALGMQPSSQDHAAARLLPVMATFASTPGSAFRPTPTALPGGAALQTLVNGVGGWALIIALAGLVIGAAMWAIGSHSQNYQQSFVGKRAVLVSGLAALVIGAAPVIVDFFFHIGVRIPLPQ